MKKIETETRKTQSGKKIVVVVDRFRDICVQRMKDLGWYPDRVHQEILKLAPELSLSRSQVCSYLTGRKGCYGHSLFAIATVLGLGLVLVEE